jgi:hypothetical protein
MDKMSVGFITEPKNPAEHAEIVSRKRVGDDISKEENAVKKYCPFSLRDALNNIFRSNFGDPETAEDVDMHDVVHDFDEDAADMMSAVDVGVDNSTSPIPQTIGSVDEGAGMNGAAENSPDEWTALRSEVENYAP